MKVLIVGTLLSFFTLTSSASPPIHQLSTFPNFIENIAVRRNNHLLLTSVQTSAIYTLDPKNPNSSISTLEPIPDATGVGGIAEIAPDIFVASAGLWNTATRRASLGSLTLWTIDMRTPTPVFQKIVTVKESVVLNGLTTVPGSPNLVLASDSELGAVYRIDVLKGTYSIAIKDPLFAPTGPAPSLGINGIRTYYAFPNSFLYFANSARGLFGRVPISTTGSAAGPISILAQLNGTDGAYDDFAIDREGRAWIATHPDSLNVVGREGKQKMFVSGTQVPDPTSAAFGRGRGNEGLLYVTTNIIGGDLETITGGVVEIDTRAQ